MHSCYRFNTQILKLNFCVLTICVKILPSIVVDEENIKMRVKMSLYVNKKLVIDFVVIQKLL